MRSESVQAERRPVHSREMKEDSFKGETFIKEEVASTLDSSLCPSPLSLIPRESLSPLNFKRESMGDEESGIDVNTVIGLAPSESPSSSDAPSSMEDGPIFNNERASFKLPLPSSSSDLSMSFICEAASRLLFLSVHWMKDVKHTGLKSSTIESLMKSKWSDVFVLGLMQCSSSSSIALAPLLNSINDHLVSSNRMGDLSSSKLAAVQEEISRLLQISLLFQGAKLSPIEFAYLKLISFTSSDLPSPHSVSPDARSTNQVACHELYDHLLSSWPQTSDDSSLEEADVLSTSSQTAAIERYSRLLQLLPTLRWLHSPLLVELFFSGLIGSLSIETVIPFVLKMDVMNVFDSSSSLSVPLSSS
ncbi:hypothetical protein PMAYCL1PPCAC_17713 [Pristionchus mayeri]|uniref:NR LBD domain-containing protein n=1 Tax=Pristionchus mayeri TaxID=1317129 RepID=A0AAN5I0N4_9BILA|nr:hypothetical protein PMAYCL1PPCAC_17713 [Pristionchus mayeri]